MIVHPSDTGWEIIHQQAHGLLAFQLALQWHSDKRSAYWPETLAALLEHDDGQDPYENTNHLTSAGAPQQYAPYSVSQCQRMLEIALRKSRWNALMVSKHASFLYEPKRGEDAKLDRFLDQQKVNQAKWQTAYDATDNEVDYAYALLQWCDALSLILCRQDIPPEGRQLEISLGPDDIPYFLRQRPEDQTLCVTPWPFEGETFAIAVEVHHLEQLAFRDDIELAKAIASATLEKRSWQFRKEA